MKGKVSITFDTETGDYELEFNNISNPGEGINYNILYEVIRRVVGQVDQDISTKDPSTTGQVVYSKDNNN